MKNKFIIPALLIVVALTTAGCSGSKAEAKTPAANSLAPYKKAYTEICEKQHSENPDLTYGFIDIDGDEIPELVVNALGYQVSLYTYANDRVYTLMDNWAYGAMGNAGYFYVPGKNHVYNSNSDFAGLLNYETHLNINAQHELEAYAKIIGVYFDDKNGNMAPDDGENTDANSVQAKYYIQTGDTDKKEIPAKEAASYSTNEAQEISGTLSYEAIIESLQ